MRRGAAATARPQPGAAAGERSGDAAAGFLPGVAADAYAAQVQRLLARRKRYPAQARARRIEGAGVLAFTVAADGAVQGARLARSAGHPLLDAEIEAMLRRVGKLPPPPQGRPLALTAPVTFRLD